MRKLYMIFSLTLLTVLVANGQAFYNAGTVTVEGTGLLYVDGDVEIASTGSVTNDGTIEIKGNYTTNRTDGAIANGASGERVVKFTATPGTTQIIQANNASNTATFYSVETQNPVASPYIAGVAIDGVVASSNIRIKGELKFSNGDIALNNNDLILDTFATVTGYNATYNAKFANGNLVKKVGPSQSAGTHQFPYFKTNMGFGVYLPATIYFNSLAAQADEVRFRFVQENNIGTIFHVGGCSNIGPGGNQNIMLNRMVENFGYWAIDVEDASNNNLDNTTGWNYDITLYPPVSALTNLQSNYGSDYFKILRRASHGTGAQANTQLPAPNAGTDWSNDVVNSGTYCNGIVEIASYSQNNGIKATQLSKFSNFGGAGNEGGASLPIELLSLEAVPVENTHIAVKWTTEVEVDNKGFEVLRSTNGEDFTVQGWVDGNGNTSTLHDYTFIDRNVEPNQLYYYRLRQLDFDNNSELSYIVNAKITAGTASVFTISDFIPNPTNNATRIDITTSEAKHVSVTIYNTLGQIIVQQEVDAVVGTTPVNFNMEEVAAGTYYGIITVDGEEFNKKLIITRQ